MKRKALYTVVVMIVLVTIATVFTAAIETAGEFNPYKNKMPTSDAVSNMITTYELQQEIGMIPSNYEILTVSYDADQNTILLLATSNMAAVTVSEGDTIRTYKTTTARDLVPFIWTTKGWQRPFTFNRSPSATMGVYARHHYYSGIDVNTVGTYQGFNGLNQDNIFGTEDCDALQIKNYFQTICDYIKGYEDDIAEAEQNGYETGRADGLNEGYEIGYELGYTNGTEDGYEKGYIKGSEDGYAEGSEVGLDAGYEMGYEAGYDEGQEVGYYLGLYDCDKTHDALTQTVREEAIAYGKTLGFALCEEGHAEMETAAYNEGYELGYETGYNEGYDAHAGAKEAELKKQYDDGYSAGKEVGYTEALNSGDVVIKYVDGLFSAPIDFLYGAFNIEILGVNLFNLFMLLLSILIVGGVILLVFKFR